MPVVTVAYITCGSESEAREIGEMLVKEKLAACANHFAISSCYFWQQKLQHDNEYVLLAKTLSNKTGALTKAVEKMHSYETPCILFFSADANEKYYKWVKNEVKAMQRSVRKFKAV